MPTPDRLVLFVLLWIACLVGEPQESPAAAPVSSPNVLLISVDDLNDWIGPLRGHPQAQTPNFDRLARRGITFTNAHCNVPICSPSRTSLMTGRQPYHTGVFTNGGSIFDLAGKYVTLPQQFAAAGYQTLGAGKLFHGSGGRYRDFFQEYGPGSGNQGGPFSREELDTMKQNPIHLVDRGPGLLKATLPLNRMPDDRRSGQPRNNTFDWGPVDLSPDEMPDGEVARWAVDQLQRQFDRPFFLGVGFYRPHQPLFAPQQYFDLFPVDSIELPVTTANDLDDLSPYAQQLALLPLTAGSHATVMNYDQWEEATAGYLACVRFVDDLLGRVLDALDNSTHADNTLVVLFSDHGYHLGQKQHWGKFTPWSESTRVPLIVVPPRSMKVETAAAGRRVTQAVSLVDLYPTIVEFCDVEQPGHELDGRSLREFFVSERVSQETNDRVAITTVGRGTYSIRSTDHRYVRYFDGTEELYDLGSDPREWKNRAADPQLAAIKRRLAERIPPDPEVAHYIRYKEWKAVIFQDERPAQLFPISPGTGSGGGIGETRSVGDQHPEVLAAIRQRLMLIDLPTKRLVLGSVSKQEN